MNDFAKKIKQLLPQMVEWRRHLHQYPELSYREQQTSNFIYEKLINLGLDVQKDVGGFGIRAFLRGNKASPVVALRADIDALPIQDEKNCDYASKVPGVMHACGHDAHTSGLLGVAHLLAEYRHELNGSVVFIFQPAEEVSPGGALAMIRDGALQNVDVIYGIHLWSPFPNGHVYSVSGPMMAIADEFTIEIVGKGGHGGLPHNTVDSIVAGAQVVANVQTIVSRNIDPLEPCVVSIGSFQAGTAFNVIAERAKLTGTVRAFSENIRQSVKARLSSIVANTCETYGTQYNYEYKEGYPAVVNHEKEANRFFSVANHTFGADHTHISPLIMAAEDFSYYLQQVPGCFMFVGAGDDQKKAVYPHHHPMFDIDEQAMANAALLFIEMTLHYFREWNEPASENL